MLGAGLALSLLVTPFLEGRTAGLGQMPRRPDPETYHWVLPAQHGGVEVVEFHPNDCYAIQRAEGMVYFGEPLPGVLELQHQLGEPRSHLVDGQDEHPECLLARCLDVSRLSDAITARLLESGNRQDRRLAGHRPTPLDNMRGGVYSDVGSDDRPRYRQAPEQRMAYLHLGTAGRGNCYEAKAPRTLTMHIRDHQQRTDRTGVYSGYLYVEHHHAAPAGRVAISSTGGAVLAFALSRATEPKLEAESRRPITLAPRNALALTPPLSRREREWPEAAQPCQLGEGVAGTLCAQPVALTPALSQRERETPEAAQPCQLGEGVAGTLRAQPVALSPPLSQREREWSERCAHEPFLI